MGVVQSGRSISIFFQPPPMPFSTAPPFLYSKLGVHAESPRCIWQRLSQKSRFSEAIRELPEALGFSLVGVS
jgi:hypothetical protein